MTYIVGINKKDHKFSAIISDIMLSIDYPNGIQMRANTGLKTGLLFKGCIYGISGDWEASKKFLLGFKKSVNKDNSISDNFKEFNKYIESNAWEKGKGFKILFSVRNPNPEFYILDSKIGKLELCKDSIVTLGSGKEILDKLVTESKVYLNKYIMRKLEEHKAPIVYYPCFLCLWLMERILGIESKYLAQKGVGGVFHFSYQTDTKECPPTPLVYVISRLSAARDKLESKAYRTLFVCGFLIYEVLQEKKMYIITSEVERRDLIGMSDEDKKRLIAEIKDYVDKQPIYYFCGFGMHDHKNRGYYAAHFSCNEKKVIDKDGNIQEDFEKNIIRNIKEGKLGI